jgi:hypothetical protein
VGDTNWRVLLLATDGVDRGSVFTYKNEWRNGHPVYTSEKLEIWREGDVWVAATAEVVRFVHLVDMSPTADPHAPPRGTWRLKAKGSRLAVGDRPPAGDLFEIVLHPDFRDCLLHNRREYGSPI